MSNEENNNISEEIVSDNQNSATTEQPEIKKENTADSYIIDDSFLDDVYKSNTVDLYKLEGLDVKDQSRVFALVLTDLYKDYDDIDYSIIRKLAIKCLKLSCDPDDNNLRLPYKLVVTKDGNKMNFSFETNKKGSLILIIILLGLFTFIALGSTYVTLRYLSIAHLNLDIDNDGIADLNIDTDKDDKENINISNDGKKPYVNIDYKGNQKAVFNVDTTGDGKADFNLINQDLDNDGVCDLNCDVNGDGWPDTNIDLNGDGKANMYIDNDNDGNADLNFDTNNNGVCNLHCDTDGDGVCDLNCVKNIAVIENNTGSSTAIGNNQADIATAEFIIDFIDSKQIVIDNLFPEDQTGNVTKYATKKITITNRSSEYVRYKIEMVVTNYTFTSDNFLYKIESTGEGYSQDYTMVPRNTSFIADTVVIGPTSTQEYTFTFKVKGLNENQNFDQGKSFSGYFQVYSVD